VIAPSSAGSGIPRIFRIGASSTAANYLRGHFGAAYIINRALTRTEINDTVTYLRTRWTI
jgi:hypothetical protein